MREKANTDPKVPFLPVNTWVEELVPVRVSHHVPSFLLPPAPAARMLNSVFTKPTRVVVIVLMWEEETELTVLITGKASRSHRL